MGSPHIPHIHSPTRHIGPSMGLLVTSKEWCNGTIFTGLSRVRSCGQGIMWAVSATTRKQTSQKTPFESNSAIRPEAIIDGDCEWEGQSGPSHPQHRSLPKKKGCPRFARIICRSRQRATTAQKASQKRRI